MNEENIDEFLQDELQVEEDLQEEHQAITIEDLEVFNMNYATGTLFTVGALGILSGALVATAFKGILRL